MTNIKRLNKFDMIYLCHHIRYHVIRNTPKCPENKFVSLMSLLSDIWLKEMFYQHVQYNTNSEEGEQCGFNYIVVFDHGEFEKNTMEI